MATPVPSEETISLSILIDKLSNKVVFAEAGSDFVDVLFSFMTVPLGTIVRLLNKHCDGQQVEALGSLNNLYESLKSLGSSNFWTEECKLTLLNPRNAWMTECLKLKLMIDDSEPKEYYICSSSYHSNISPYIGSTCSSCGRLLNQRSTRSPYSKNLPQPGVFTAETILYIITDDLRVMPSSADFSIQLLNDYGAESMDMLEEKTLDVGLEEIVQLFGWSLLSRTPLANIALDKPLPESHIRRNEPIKGVCSPQNLPAAKAGDSNKKIGIKVMMQKSTEKLLFVQAGDDFIDFLFSLLSIPLATAVSLLGGNSNLGSIDQLYKSISVISPQEVQRLLLEPILPYHYLSKNQLLPLIEKPHCPREYVFQDPKRSGSFVKGPAMFMVTDDLTVTPMSSISIFSFLNRRKIAPRDVEETVLNIGTEEAIAILRATLNSSSALTSALQPLISKKKPKQEQ